MNESAAEPHAAPYMQGERRCVKCGKVHDAHLLDPGSESSGFSWADPSDGHSYYQEDWREVAFRYGWSREAERERYGVAG